MVEKIGSQALWYNNSLEHLYMPMLQQIGEGKYDGLFDEILHANKVLKSVYVPKLQYTMPKEYDRLNAIVAQNNIQCAKYVQQMTTNARMSATCK